MDSQVYVFSGQDVKKFYNNEIGTHRFQRVSPTEKRGRVHTSSITVAVLEDSNYKEIEVQPYEVKIETIRGSGKGGQHRNVTDSCVVMTHHSTGIKVTVDGRDQHKNKEMAYKEISKRVNDLYRESFNNDITEERRDQVGYNSVTDKRRTYRFKDNLVIDHITNKSVALKDILRGKLGGLH